MIQWQEVCMPYDHKTGFAAARFLQRVQEARQQSSTSPGPSNFEEGSAGGTDTHCNIHEILLFKVGCLPAGFTAS